MYLASPGVVENPAAVAKAKEMGLTDMDCNNPLKAIPEWCVFPASLRPGRSIQACVPQWASFANLAHSEPRSFVGTNWNEGWVAELSVPALPVSLSPVPLLFPAATATGTPGRSFPAPAPVPEAFVLHRVPERTGFSSPLASTSSV